MGSVLDGGQRLEVRGKTSAGRKSSKSQVNLASAEHCEADIILLAVLILDEGFLHRRIRFLAILS